MMVMICMIARMRNIITIMIITIMIMMRITMIRMMSAIWMRKIRRMRFTR